MDIISGYSILVSRLKFKPSQSAVQRMSSFTTAVRGALKYQKHILLLTAMAKRKFTVNTGTETFELEGHEPRATIVKYLMKRRRSLLMTKDPAKVETLFSALPQTIEIKGTKSNRSYKVKWERVGTGEFVGARFTFTLEEAAA
ncbi:MAG: hypothetical protein HY619_02140 [Thaumarchaeota archaeon]|nr:hypothetical protein [Nitrososphaerota archaeon]